MDENKQDAEKEGVDYRDEEATALDDEEANEVEIEEIEAEMEEVETVYEKAEEQGGVREDITGNLRLAWKTTKMRRKEGLEKGGRGGLTVIGLFRDFFKSGKIDDALTTSHGGGCARRLRTCERRWPWWWGMISSFSQSCHTYTECACMGHAAAFDTT
jgi:hypothetical protein